MLTGCSQAWMILPCRECGLVANKTIQGSFEQPDVDEAMHMPSAGRTKQVICPAGFFKSSFNRSLTIFKSLKFRI
jgi:hypothetical protein